MVLAAVNLKRAAVSHNELPGLWCRLIADMEKMEKEARPVLIARLQSLIAQQLNRDNGYSSDSGVLAVGAVLL